jgi:glutamate-1-semialdehyde 2,1-aminomutase
VTRKPRTAREQGLLDTAARLLPAGVRGATASPAQALVVSEGKGSRIRDASGNEYIDYLLGSGAIFTGHADPAVIAAVNAAVAKGSGYLLLNEYAIALADTLVRAVPCAERISLHSTGTDATFFAMRLARANRGRDKILKFEGGFHGMSDYALMSNQWTRTLVDAPAAVPNSAGIPRAVQSDVLTAPFNDAERAVEIIDRHHDELAAVIVEPMQRTITPRPGFLEALREATQRHGIVLIYDEIVTGFRLAYGSGQEYYGVVPDLCAIGKSISAGHPISAVCGRADLMDHLDPSVRTAAGYVAQTGTYSGNPVSAAAALAVLGQLGKPAVYEALFAKGRRLIEGLRTAFAKAGIAAQVLGEPPAFETWFTAEPIFDFRSSLRADPAMHARFAELLLERGVLKGHEKFFVSTAHTDEDVEFTIDAFRSASAALARERHNRGC